MIDSHFKEQRWSRGRINYNFTQQTVREVRSNQKLKIHCPKRHEEREVHLQVVNLFGCHCTYGSVVWSLGKKNDDKCARGGRLGLVGILLYV